jgi:hypothetical protein
MANPPPFVYCRITLEMVITKSEIVPINVGVHDEVY